MIRIKLALSALSFCLILTLSGQSSDALADQVSLVPLDQELPSRSQLGGVCVDRLGFVYVSNFREAVWKISPKGKVQLLTDGLYGASGNTIDAKGNLYQANFISHSILKIDRFGKITTFVEKGLNGPVGMVIDQNNFLYVCNFNENNILKISPEGAIDIFAEGELFSGPNGITIDNEDNLYVVNFNSSTVVKINPVGQTSIFATTGGADGNAHIAYFSDNFFVTKIKSNQVFRLNRAGEQQLLGGTGQSTTTEGIATQASFNAPNGIGVDPITGEIYVNTVNGNWGSRQPSTILLSKISLLSLTKILSHHIEENDLEAAKTAFWAYHRDPFHAEEDLGPALANLGWQSMVKRNVPASIAIFDLANEAYPDRWRTYYNLGEVYKIIGQADQAKSYYNKALEKDPENQLVIGKLKSLK